MCIASQTKPLFWYLIWGALHPKIWMGVQRCIECLIRKDVTMKKYCMIFYFKNCNGAWTLWWWRVANKCVLCVEGHVILWFKWGANFYYFLSVDYNLWNLVHLAKKKVQFDKVEIAQISSWNLGKSLLRFELLSCRFHLHLIEFSSSHVDKFVLEENSIFKDKQTFSFVSFFDDSCLAEHLVKCKQT